MVNINDIHDFFEEKKFSFIKEVRLRPSDGCIVATVPNNYLAQKVGKGKTSKRQMTYIRKDIKDKFNSDIEFIITKSDTHKKFEDGLFALVDQRLPDMIDLCFLSFPRPEFADVWLEFRQLGKISDQSKEQIESIVKNYLKLLNIKEQQIHWGLGELSLPTTAAILRVIKISAPVELDGITAKLLQSDFSWPSDTWLKNRLDLLRKKGFLLRQKDKSYVLSQESLSKVPHGTYRSSSDVERALALGRRKW